MHAHVWRKPFRRQSLNGACAAACCCAAAHLVHHHEAQRVAHALRLHQRAQLVVEALQDADLAGLQRLHRARLAVAPRRLLRTHAHARGEARQARSGGHR